MSTAAMYGPIRRRPGPGKRRSQEPTDHALGRSRGGYETKIHVVTDGHRVPLAVHATAGQADEMTAFEPVVSALRIRRGVGRPRSRPARIAGDRGFDIPSIRRWLWRRGIKAVIPEKAKPHGRQPGRPPVLDREVYGRRDVVERCVGWLKQARRIATRFEKIAVNFLAMLELAMIQRYLRECSPIAT